MDTSNPVGSLGVRDDSIRHTNFATATHYYRTEFGWHTYLLEDVKSLEAKMKTPKGRAWVKINADMLTEKALIALEISDELEMFESEGGFSQTS